MKRASKHRDQVHPTENFDRARRFLPQRISCGLRVDDGFRRVDGILLMVRSCGKWMRPSVYRTVSVEIPESVRRQGTQLLGCAEPGAKQYSELCSDLANAQSHAVGLLLSGSVKMLDNVLAASVEDPGLWRQDFDGAWNYQSLCDSQRLAEQTGLSVIDAFPARDLAVSGNGRKLDGLANWLWFAQRDPKVSNRGRMLVQLDKQLEMSYLPPSDGLEAEMPRLQFLNSPGLSLAEELLKLISPAKPIEVADGKLAVQGMVDGDLLEFLQRQFDSTLLASPVRFLELQLSQEELAPTIAEWIRNRNCSIANVLCSLFHFYARQIGEAMSQFSRRATRSGEPVVGEIILAGEAAESGLLQQLISIQTGLNAVSSSKHFGVGPKQLGLANTCLLGMMHIDQMPANLPAATGADCPRLLGRLTPGKPSNWRRLVTEMADYRPPAMKLRDAV